MKNKLFLFAITFLFYTCSGPKEVVKTVEKKKVDILLLANQCTDKDPLSLYKFNGIGFTKIKALKKIGKDSFSLQLPQADPRFLYVGTDAQAKLPVIFSDENMSIKGSCKSFRSSSITNSEYNDTYSGVLKMIRQNKRDMQVKLGEYRQARNAPDKQASIKKELAIIDQKQIAFLDSMKVKNPFIANIAGLGTMMSYPNKADKYSNEVDYFAAEYFKNADLKSPVFNNIPYLFEAFKEYAQTLASVNLPEEVVTKLIDQNLKMVPDSSQAMRYALGGALLGLQAKNNPAFGKYAKSFITKFEKTTDKVSLDRLKGQLDQAKSFVTGGEAPEIEMKTPEGEMLKLSDLKGQVVLIDFWASWCGPCRKENPNVVKVYNKYNEAGFEILGVSLDKTKDKWLKAIAKDGLTWPHVSDLRGWQNKAAQTYGVRSIPHTVLVDREGKIIARNLRGPALERKLAEIFD